MAIFKVVTVAHRWTLERFLRTFENSAQLVKFPKAYLTKAQSSIA